MFKKTISILILCLNFSVASIAAVPTTSSLKKLIEVTQSKIEYQTQLEYAEKSYNDMIQQLLESQKTKLTESQHNNLQQVLAEMLSMLLEDSQWEDLEPDVIKIFQEIYTQHEVDSMIAYYQTSIGQSILKKMPLVTQKSNEISQIKMDKFTSELIKKIDQVSSQ